MENKKISWLLWAFVCWKESWTLFNNKEEEILLHNPNETYVRKNIPNQVNDVSFQVAQEFPQTHRSDLFQNPEVEYFNFRVNQKTFHDNY